MLNKFFYFIIFCCSLFFSCTTKKESTQSPDTTVNNPDSLKGNIPIVLPAPYATPSATNNSNVLAWPANKTPKAPEGFSVKKFADQLKNPRWVYVGTNGDIFVSEAKTKSGSANRITLLRDANNDGVPELNTVFLTGLNQPFGMLIIGNTFYVANTDGILTYPYTLGQTQITTAGKKIISLPAGGYNNHWTRNIIANKDKTKLYISVGSGSNVGENGMNNEIRRAAILETNIDGTGEIVYASGLRNPVGMDFATGTNTLWTSVNERDELGDELVPDYLTSVKKEGFYGWPYAYWGKYEDPRLKGQRPDLVAKSIAPEVDLGSHTASLGLAFDKNNALPGKYKGGAFIGQHGSWNSAKLVGYQVCFVPFKNGNATGKREPFLTEFAVNNKDVYGRPVCIAFTAANDMLVTDDVSGIIWWVHAN